MNSEFKKAYDKLSLNDKRNELSNELLVINNLINYFENKYGVTIPREVKNYDVVNDENKNEEEMLSFFYEDIYNIEKSLITVINLIEKNDNRQV